MDSRTQARIPTDKSVAVTVLTAPEMLLEARVKDVSSLGMGIEAPQKVAAGAVVKIEAGDELFLGEVVHCRASEGGWLLGVRLTHVLSGLAALSRMAREFNAALHPASR